MPRGDEVVTVANQLAARFDFVVASQDWHPPGRQSFASQHRGHLRRESATTALASRNLARPATLTSPRWVTFRIRGVS